MPKSRVFLGSRIAFAAWLWTGAYTILWAEEPVATEAGKNAATERTEEGEAKSPPHADAVDKKLRAWLPDTKRGFSEALRLKRPILVRLGAEWCGPCHGLAAEIEKPEVQQALERWTVVYIDIDKSPNEARAHGAASIPALRVLTPTGRQVASSEGSLAAAELIAWLDTNFDAGDPETLAQLQGDEAPQEGDVPALLRHFQNRDPAIREAALQRLLPHRQVAAMAVTQALAEGNLQTRLAALELLKEWKAPVTRLDPWQPETLTAPLLKDLDAWAEKAGASAAVADQLTPERRKAARDQIAEMLKTEDDAHVRAIRERLAIFGRALLPEVYAQLKDAATDRLRERLTALRYRLVAARGLALRWPSGVERLAATQADVRRQAFDELAKEATAEDEALLLELFSDPDPLFREISLRILQEVSGTSATSGIIQLLDDPAPNVRAAVLNELAEHPSPRTVPRIVAYIARETDPDLVVHAVRTLRASKGKAAIDCLLTLFQHKSWHVRAEAAEAIAKCIDRRHSSSGNESVAAEVYVALIDLLKDGDGFVVSHAIHALEHADLLLAVEPLAKTVKAHPELATDAIAALTEGSKTRSKAVPHLREFFKDADPRIRAAAITGLHAALSHDAHPELEAGLSDAHTLVRTSAAWSLFALLDAHHLPAAASESELTDAGDEPGLSRAKAGVEMEEAVPVPPQPTGLLERVFKLLLPTTAPAPGPAKQPRLESDAAPEPDVAGSDAKKETQPADDLGDGNDAALMEFHAGKGRPEWIPACIPALQKMVGAPEAPERVAAALCLTAIGKLDISMPALLSIAKSDRSLQEQVAGALPWLPWKARLQLFDDLLALHPGPEPLSKIAGALIKIRDRRAEQPLWRITAAAEMNSDAGNAVLGSLRGFYFGTRYWDESKIKPRQRKRAAAEARPRAAAGPKWQRLVALALLLPVASDEAAETARSSFAEPEADDALRTFALAVLLASQSKADGEKAAVAAISDKSPEIRKAALMYLVQGPDRLTSHAPLNMQLPQIVSTASTDSGEETLSEPPGGLTVEALRPFLSDIDPEVTACAGYLLALLGRRDGLDLLMRYWRLHGIEDPSWTQAVYRAVAHVNDDGLVPVLEEIYNRFGKENYQIREFYWTIRSMTGPNILKLRKRIRSEVGMQRLQ